MFRCKKNELEFSRVGGDKFKELITTSGREGAGREGRVAKGRSEETGRDEGTKRAGVRCGGDSRAVTLSGHCFLSRVDSRFEIRNTARDIELVYAQGRARVALPWLPRRV